MGCYYSGYNTYHDMYGKLHTTPAAHYYENPGYKAYINELNDLRNKIKQYLSDIQKFKNN